MTASLSWVPVIIQEPNYLDDHLKNVLAKTLLVRHGSLVVKTKDCAYFRGLADAGVKGAPEVVAAIEWHGAIKLILEEPHEAK